MRVERSRDAVMQQHVGDRREERDPVLIERDHDDHHEEVEVHLDDAAREMHEHGGCGQDADRRRERARAPRKRRVAGDERRGRQDQRLEQRVRQGEPADHGEDRDDRSRGPTGAGRSRDDGTPTRRPGRPPPTGSSRRVCFVRSGKRAWIDAAGERVDSTVTTDPSGSCSSGRGEERGGTARGSRVVVHGVIAARGRSAQCICSLP